MKINSSHYNKYFLYYLNHEIMTLWGGYSASLPFMKKVHYLNFNRRHFLKKLLFCWNKSLGYNLT